MDELNKERNVDRLAGLVMRLGILAVIVLLCWYFRSVLVYIVIAFVFSLIGQPLMRLMRRVKIRGRSLPDGLLAVLTIILILVGALLFITQFIPVITGIVRDASAINATNVSYNSLIDPVNEWIYGLFPSVGRDFDIVTLLLDKIKEVVNLSNVSSVLGSVASAAASIAVGLFSVVFISFFFIKDETLFGQIVCAVVPDRVEASVNSTINDVTHLLSRYFIGLIIEIVGVILLDFLGLWLIVRIGPDYVIGIAFIAGLLNVIPYVGPLLGEIIGVLLCLVLKFGTGVGLNVPVWAFVLIVLAVMLAVQLVDNFIYQPLIYSTSIKAKPLEIFIVLLMAGQMGGTVGLLVGIPAYTVVRVIAIRYFADKKLVRRLIPDIDEENTQALI